jgi:hypothetical protein
VTVSARVRRRRLSFVALLSATFIAGTLAFVRADDQVSEVGGRPAGTAAPSSAISSTAPATSSVAPSTDMPPAWLAWITGSLPSGFAQRAAAAPALGTTVVVAGDTRWMSASRDASGHVLDRPDPPYAIPIDAFAVDPDAYAPFVPDAFRTDVTDALHSGAAVLGSSSAALRRLDVGGSMTFAGRTIRVGAIVPDDVAGWSEMLVSRALGQRLGIVDDRYLLAEPGDGMHERRFASIMSNLLPDTDVRMLPPGGSAYMRIASGVNPPVVMKEIFGEFSAYPRSDDPAFLNVDPAWYDRHIRTRTVPLLGTVTCNVKLFPSLIGALTDVEAAGLGGEIHVYSGCYAARTVARSPTAPPSQHAYGAAIDIDAPENPYGGTPTMDPRIVKIFRGWGFVWGGTFLTPDGMHFEYGGPPRQSR